MANDCPYNVHGVYFGANDEDIKLLANREFNRLLESRIYNDRSVDESDEILASEVVCVRIEDVLYFRKTMLAQMLASK